MKLMGQETPATKFTRPRIETGSTIQQSGIVVSYKSKTSEESREITGIEQRDVNRIEDGEELRL